MKQLSLLGNSVQLPIKVAEAVTEILSGNHHGSRTILTGPVRWDIRISPETEELSVFRVPNSSTIDGLRSRIVKLEVAAKKTTVAIIPEAADSLSQEEKDARNAEAAESANEAAEKLAEAKAEFDRLSKKYEPVHMSCKLSDLPKFQDGSLMVGLQFGVKKGK